MPGIPFIKDFKFDYGTAMEVTPLIRRVVANNPNPFTFKGTGTYIIGHGKVAVVDPGPDQQDHIDAVLRALRGETVTHIFVTHTHIDHVPATHAVFAAALRDHRTRGRALELLFEVAVRPVPGDQASVRIVAIVRRRARSRLHQRELAVGRHPQVVRFDVGVDQPDRVKCRQPLRRLPRRPSWCGPW